MLNSLKNNQIDGITPRLPRRKRKRVRRAYRVAPLVFLSAVLEKNTSASAVEHRAAIPIVIRERRPSVDHRRAEVLDETMNRFSSSGERGSKMSPDDRESDTD